MQSCFCWARIDNGGGNDVLKQYNTSPEMSSRLNFLSGGNMGISTSMNGRELRKTPLESPIEKTDSKPSEPKSQQEAIEPLCLNNIDGSERNPLSICNSDVPSSALYENGGAQNICQSAMVEDNVDSNKFSSKMVTVESRTVKLATADNDDDILIVSSPSSGLQGLCTSYRSTFEGGGFENEFESTFREAAEKDALDDNSQGSLSADFEGQIDFYEKQGVMFSEENSVLEKDNDGKWRFPSLSSILQGGREIVNGEKKSLFGWESGPYSAAAEAWARTRQRLGSLGTSEKNKSHKLPIGVRDTSDLESETFTFGREEGKEWDQLALFNFAAPLKRVLSSGLEAVADMYNAASARIFKKDESEEAKQVSSFLSERAASMLVSYLKNILSIYPSLKIQLCVAMTPNHLSLVRNPSEAP